MIVPHEDVVNRLSKEITQGKNVFPVSWAVSGYEVMQGLQASSSTTYAELTFNDLDFDGYSSHTVDLQVFNMASVTDYIPQSSITLARNVMKYVMWFGFSISILLVMRKVI